MTSEALESQEARKQRLIAAVADDKIRKSVSGLLVGVPLVFRPAIKALLAYLHVDAAHCMLQCSRG